MTTSGRLHIPAFATTAEILGYGGVRRELDKQIESGDVVRVRRGAYVAAQEWDAATPQERHLTLVAATVAPIVDIAVVSHRSAAVVQGIPFLGAPPDRVEMTVPRSRATRSTRHTLVHYASHTPSAEQVGDLWVTTAARTAIDIARSMDFASGMMAVNDVLHRGLASEEMLLSEIDQLFTKAAPRRALDVVERADGRAESAGESVTLARFHQLDVPIPDLQRSIRTEPGVVDRPDFAWDDPLRFMEFDGDVKYHRGAFGSNLSLEEIVRAEKVREDRLRRIASAVGRVTCIDSLRVDGLIRELRRIDVLKGRPAARSGLRSANGLW